MQKDENCYPDKMFNPNLKKCDSISTVLLLKPNCAIDPGETDPDYATGEKKTFTRKPTVPTYENVSPPFSGTEHTLDIVGIPSYFTLCGPEAELKIEHPENCSLYLECLQKPNGSYYYTEKNCGSNLMFNPKLKACDARDEVILVKSVCGVPRLIIENQVKNTTVFPRVPSRSYPTKVPTPSPITIRATATPPQHCDEFRMDPLLHYLPDSSFTASSFLGKPFRPEAARLNSRPAGGSVSFF